MFYRIWTALYVVTCLYHLLLIINNNLIINHLMYLKQKKKINGNYHAFLRKKEIKLKVI
jgi:hypothetical protein